MLDLAAVPAVPRSWAEDRVRFDWLMQGGPSGAATARSTPTAEPRAGAALSLGERILAGLEGSRGGAGTPGGPAQARLDEIRADLQARIEQAQARAERAMERAEAKRARLEDLMEQLEQDGGAGLVVEVRAEARGPNATATASGRAEVNGQVVEKTVTAPGEGSEPPEGAGSYSYASSFSSITRTADPEG